MKYNKFSGEVVNFSEIIPQSSTHWKGKMSLVVVSSTHKKFNTKEVLETLKKYGQGIEAIVVMGEDPCLQSDLPIFAKRMKLKNLKVKIETYGKNPENLDTLISRRSVDFISLKIENLSTETMKSIDYLKKGSIDYEIIINYDKIGEEDTKKLVNDLGKEKLVIYSEHGDLKKLGIKGIRIRSKQREEMI